LNAPISHIINSNINGLTLRNVTTNLYSDKCGFNADGLSCAGIKVGCCEPDLGPAVFPAGILCFAPGAGIEKDPLTVTVRDRALSRRTGAVLPHNSTSYGLSPGKMRKRTSSSVPLNGPGLSILIEARAAANFNEPSTSWSSLRARYAPIVVSPRPVLPWELLLENLSKYVLPL